tara:strand:- start:686 stop:2272 length:1587 start_codon:yes stop_codon:yes gene_type:complete
MARLTENLSLKTGQGDNYNFSVSENYNEVFNLRQEVDNSDGFIKLIGSSASISAQNLQNVKSMVVKNHGRVSSEIQIKLTEYKNNSNVDDANSVDTGGGATVARYASFLLGAGEYIFLPNVRWVGYNAAVSAANAKPTTNGAYLTLDTNEYVASGALTTEGFADDDDTTITFDDGSSGAANSLFSIGDLIRLDNEVCRVTSIVDTAGDGAYTPANFIVERGLYGTSKADHTNNTAITLPFFNAYGDYDDFSVTQTDSSGRFKAHNFFGFGRVGDSTADGIVAGSIAGKFYKAGYQACGMKGITPQTNSGLAVSTAYYFSIAVDGGSALEVTFTTDGSNVSFGGTTGIIRKIQDALDAQYYTEGNLFEKRIMVGLVDGDLRFTSGQYLSTSAIALTAGTSGGANTTNLFDTSNRIARFPASPSGAVAAKLPPDTIIDTDGISVPNTSVFFYDDGHGNIRGAATGSINYQTGAIDFTGLPNAEFAITANYDSAHGGGANNTSNSENVITTVSARSCNSKVNCPIEIVAFN